MLTSKLDSALYVEPSQRIPFWRHNDHPLSVSPSRVSSPSGLPSKVRKGPKNNPRGALRCTWSPEYCTSGRMGLASGYEPPRLPLVYRGHRPQCRTLCPLRLGTGENLPGLSSTCTNVRGSPETNANSSLPSSSCRRAFLCHKHKSRTVNGVHHILLLHSEHRTVRSITPAPRLTEVLSRNNTCLQ